MRGYCGALAALALLAGCGTGPTMGDQQNNGGADAAAVAQAGSGPFESCYASTQFDTPAPAPARELFVVIDQTTALNARLAGSLTSKVADFLDDGPGRVTIASFSANTVGNFATVDFTGEAEGPVAQDMRNSVNARKLELLDACLGPMPRNLAARATAEINALVRTDSGDFANSEIIGSLAALSEAVRASQAQDKRVLVVSDMLEHSSTTSFYQNRGIRDFDTMAELQRVADRHQFGDFGGAQVYVMGAGLLPPEAQQNETRDSARLLRLREFWQNWFENSNAHLVGYGQPDLIVGLQ